jgi:PAS domain S-box-containing protein
MKFKNKLLLVIYPSILIPVAVIVAANFLFTSRQVTALEYALLTNTVNNFVGRINASVKAMDALGMANVEFYQSATKKQALQDIQSSQQPGASLVVIDAESKEFVFSTDGASQGLLLDVGQINAMITQGHGQGAYAVTTQSGISSVAITSFALYPRWNWLIVSSTNEKQSNRYIANAAVFTLGLAGVFLIVVFFLVHKLSARVVRNLAELDRSAASVARGNFDTVINVHTAGEDEFSSLASTFNAMGAAIKHGQAAQRESDAALRESDAFFRAVVDTVPGMLAYWGTDLTCRFANGAYLEWFGRAPSEMEGLSMQTLLGDTLFQTNQPFVRGALSGEIQKFEHTLVKANGDNAYTWTQYIPHWKDGKVCGFLAMATDVSEIKKVQADLEVSLKDKEALLKEVHHRVKNNLQVINSLLRLESHRSTVGDTKTVLGDMQSRIRAMALLHESLYRSGTFASVDLGSYLRQVATQAFQAQSSNSGRVRLELNLGSVRVSMDQAIPCGLLINELISNCLKHGFPADASGRVSIDLQPQDSANRWSLQVSDTGVGLPENFEDKRMNSLGLQLVDDLTRQLDGELKITANQDQGVAFTVFFLALEPVPLVMPV